MSYFTKVALVFASIVVFTAISIIAGAGFQNWRLEQQVRDIFSLTEKHITAQEIQAYLEKTFPIGTPKLDIERFLTQHIMTTDFTVVTSVPDSKSLSYMVDCGSRHLGTRDRILLEFIFQKDTDRLQRIAVQDKSIAL